VHSLEEIHNLMNNMGFKFKHKFNKKKKEKNKNKNQLEQKEGSKFEWECNIK